MSESVAEAPKDGWVIRLQASELVARQSNARAASKEASEDEGVPTYVGSVVSGAPEMSPSLCHSGDGCSVVHVDDCSSIAVVTEGVSELTRQQRSNIGRRAVTERYEICARVQLQEPASEIDRGLSGGQSLRTHGWLYANAGHGQVDVMHAHQRKKRTAAAV